ncbi:MAG: MoxR family ATPase [Thermodesulfobacteriota bacterium]
MTPRSIEETQEMLAGQNYVSDRSLATVVFLALGLGKPLFLEGEAGVGKTEVAKVLALGLGRRLIRLQCYEGLDVAAALYEWNYPKQLLRLKAQEVGPADRAPDIFTEEYLIKRPLLEAIQAEGEDEHVVLLIDEVDRSDEEFEAFLMEVLSDFTVSIPEIGTLRAKSSPVVVLTSNRTREIHDALKRRCLFHWIDYPSVEKEYEIVRCKAPGISERLAGEVCRFMAEVRGRDFLKRPGVAETLDWARALLLLEREVLDPETVRETLGCIFKYEEDLRRFREDGALARYSCVPGAAA